MSPKLSILIISWNSWAHLKRCLESIQTMSFRDFEIIVADNNSTDGTLESLERHFPDVRLDRSSTNVGHCRRVNEGFRLARGEYVLLLDADTELSPDMVSQLMDFMTSHPDISLVAPRTYYSDGRIQEIARGFPSFMSCLFGRQTLLTRLFPDNPFTARYLQRENLDKTEPFQVDQVSASCMLMPRKLIEETGPWDEGYSGYWVDTDWCMRLKELGNKVYCVPSARIVHHESNRPDAKKSFSRIWMFHCGAFRLYRKHYTRGSMDPRLLIALGVLGLRLGVTTLVNALRPSRSEPAGSRGASGSRAENVAGASEG